MVSFVLIAPVVFPILWETWYDYLEFVRGPFIAASRNLQQQAEGYLQRWFEHRAADVKCMRCLQMIVGLMYLQQGPVHYGCINRSLSLKEHPLNHLRALKGKLLYCDAGEDV